MLRENDQLKITPNDRGSALVYILIAIALIAALTISFMQPSSQQTSSQNSYKLVSELASQADFIRTNIQECVVLHPGGDATINVTPPNTDVGANMPFPLDPRSTHLTALVPPATTTASLVSELRCPGNPGDDPNHVLIFFGNSGKFMPPPPALFDPWQWYNGPDGAFFWTSTSKTDAYILSALQKLEGQFGSCESDIIDSTAAQKNLDNAGKAVCAAGTYCFRVWMITDHDHGPPDDTETSMYPDKTACNTP